MISAFGLGKRKQQLNWSKGERLPSWVCLLKLSTALLLPSGCHMTAIVLLPPGLPTNKTLHASHRFRHCSSLKSSVFCLSTCSSMCVPSRMDFGFCPLPSSQILSYSFSQPLSQSKSCTNSGLVSFTEPSNFLLKTHSMCDYLVFWVIMVTFFVFVFCINLNES